MSLNTQELIKQTHQAAAKLLREQGYISVVDVLMAIEKLSKEDYERWRFRKVPYLEQVITVNLHKINMILRTIHQQAQHGNLQASKTVYLSWGKGPKTRLRFSKSGDPQLEDAYATHFLKPRGKREESGEDATLALGPGKTADKRSLLGPRPRLTAGRAVVLGD